MDWCCQASSHYLSQCWLRSILCHQVVSLGHNELNTYFIISYSAPLSFSFKRNITISVLKSSGIYLWGGFNCNHCWVNFKRLLNVWLQCNYCCISEIGSMAMFGQKLIMPVYGMCYVHIDCLSNICTNFVHYLDFFKIILAYNNFYNFMFEYMYWLGKKNVIAFKTCRK